ncbi:MAG: hypothetical protein GY861_02065 [bacterium]|nr:hypothetical protein [bacterium]
MTPGVASGITLALSEENLNVTLLEDCYTYFDEKDQLVRFYSEEARQKYTEYLRGDNES